MQDREFRKLLTDVGALSPAQFVALEAAVKAHLGADPNGTAAPPSAPSPSSEPALTRPPSEAGCASIDDIEAKFATAPAKDGRLPLAPRCRVSEVTGLTEMWHHA